MRIGDQPMNRAIDRFLSIFDNGTAGFFYGYPQVDFDESFSSRFFDYNGTFIVREYL